MISNITYPIALGQATANYVIKEAEGFGSGDVEVMKWNRPGFHGVKTPRAFWRERIMRLIIGVRASTSAEYETRRRDLVYTTSFPIEFNSFLCIDTTIAKKVFNFLKDFFISIHYIYYWYITYTLFYFLWFSFSDIKTTFAIDKSSNIIDCNHWYYYNIYYNRLKGGILL